VVGLGRPRQEILHQDSNHRNSRGSRGHRSADEGSRTQGHDSTNGITLSYDVWRTVEDNGPGNGQNGEVKGNVNAVRDN